MSSMAVDTITNAAGTGSPTATYGVNGIQTGYVGTAQTSDGTTTSATYADFTHQPTLTFTPTVSGNFKIGGSFTVLNTGAGTVGLTVVSSAGSPTTVFNQDTIQVLGSNIYANQNPYLVATLTAGVSYSFKLQMKANANTGTLSSSLVPNGHVLIAQQFV